MNRDVCRDSHYSLHGKYTSTHPSTFLSWLIRWEKTYGCCISVAAKVLFLNWFASHFTTTASVVESIQDSSRRLRIQLKDRLSTLINPVYLFFCQLSPRFWNELTKIGHFQSSESILKVKYPLNLPKNDFLLRILN